MDRGIFIPDPFGCPRCNSNHSLSTEVDMNASLLIVGIPFILFVLFTWLLVSLYNKSQEKANRYKAYQDYLLQHGTEQQKQTILIERLNEQLQQTRQAAGWWILFH